ncbi:hypothetical protein ACQ86O_21550 [Serratia sp. L9]|uniref:hypothetical protein n=1 Tax=Serratia sp. L9 TaxID=3423946 RepID=UPI003D6745FC
MFSKSLTRITLLALAMVASCMLFYDEGFAGFAPDWQWQRGYQPQQPAIIMHDQRLSSFQNGVLLTGISDAINIQITDLDRKTYVYSYDRSLQIDLLADDAPALLNLQITPDKQVIRAALESRTGRSSGRYAFRDRALVPVSHIITEQDGQLRVSARYIGVVAEQQCDTRGHCLIVFGKTPYAKDAVFYSADGGRHWQWLPKWQAPEADGTYQILGITGPQSLLLVQQGKLYRSDDLGQHWQVALDMAPLLAEKGIDPSLYTSHWRYNGYHNLVIWHEVNRDEDDVSPHFLLTDFNLQSSSIQSNQWGEGSIIAAESSPQGDFYFVLAQEPRQRYTLNQLQTDGTLKPRLQTGKKALTKLYTGNKLFMIAKQVNDPAHMTVSLDNGQSWFRMKKLPNSYEETVLFDSWHNRLFRFPRQSYHYPKLGNDAGLVYETVVVE